MICFLLFCSIFSAITAQQNSLLHNTDVILKMMGIELDKDCTTTKISRYNDIVSELENCVNVRSDLILQFIEPDEVMDKICRNKNLSICSDLLRQKLDPCLNEAQKNFFYYSAKSDEAMMEYICSDGVDNLLAVAKFDIGKCSGIHDIQKCAQNFSFANTVKAEAFYNEENCMKRYGISNCFMDLLNSCEDKSAYKLKKKLNDAEFNATPCKEYISGDNTSDQKITSNPKINTSDPKINTSEPKINTSDQKINNFVLIQIRNYFF